MKTSMLTGVAGSKVKESLVAEALFSFELPVADRFAQVMHVQTV